MPAFLTAVIIVQTVSKEIGADMEEASNADYLLSPGVLGDLLP
jgi:hypothetical protein